MQVKFKKLNPNAKIPIKAHKHDAAFDLVAITKEVKIEQEVKNREVVNSKVKYWEYGTGLSISIPKNHVGLIFPRSSISDTCMNLSNSVGVIDSGYLGEIRFRFRDTGNKLRQYEVGDKIGQLLIIPFPEMELVEVNELEETERSTSGFGSSGR